MLLLFAAGFFPIPPFKRDEDREDVAMGDEEAEVVVVVVEVGGANISRTKAEYCDFFCSFALACSFSVMDFFLICSTWRTAKRYLFGKRRRRRAKVELPIENLYSLNIYMYCLLGCHRVCLTDIFPFAMEGERVVAVLIVIGRLELGFMVALSLLLLLVVVRFDFVNVFLCIPATDVVFPFSVYVLLLFLVAVVAGLPFWLVVLLLFFPWMGKLAYLFQ